jgi:hypothetical protein
MYKNIDTVLSGWEWFLDVYGRGILLYKKKDISYSKGHVLEAFRWDDLGGHRISCK